MKISANIANGIEDSDSRISFRSASRLHVHRGYAAAALQLEYADLASGEEVDIPVSSAGRIIARRVMGKLGFERIRAKVQRNPNSAHMRPR